MTINKTGHGPHLLRDFYKDVMSSRQEAQDADNQTADMDDRADRLDLGQQQIIVRPDGIVIRELDNQGETNMLVWLSAQKSPDGRYLVDQKGYQRDQQGYYAFPLHLEGKGDLPFDPPEAQRIASAEFQLADSDFQSQWLIPIRHN